MFEGWSLAWLVYSFTIYTVLPVKELGAVLIFPMISPLSLTANVHLGDRRCRGIIDLIVLTDRVLVVEIDTVQRLEAS